MSLILRMALSLFCCFLSLLWLPFSQAEIKWFLSDEESFHKWAIIPSYRSEGTLGHVIGWRFFIYPSEKKGSYFAVSSDWKPQQNNDLSFKIQGMHWGDHEFSFKSKIGRFFDPYYESHSHSRVEVPVKKAEFKGYYFLPMLQTFGALLEYKFRKELGQPCFFVRQYKMRMKEPCRAFSDEQGGALGVIIQSDTRDQIFNPKEGRLYRTELKLGYEFIQKGPLFFQLESKVKYIFSGLEDERWIFTLALGYSLFNKKSEFSSLPYSWQFKLGGINNLRGYQSGRFHSDQYYLVQGEFRWLLTRWMQSLIFIDMGQTSFKWPKFTGGLGFTLGFPPSYGKKIRFEMGWSSDQRNFVIAFDQPY